MAGRPRRRARLARKARVVRPRWYDDEAAAERARDDYYASRANPRRVRRNAKADWTKVDGQWVRKADLAAGRAPAPRSTSTSTRAPKRDKALERAARAFFPGHAARSDYFSSWDRRERDAYEDTPAGRERWERDRDRFDQAYSFGAERKAGKKASRDFVAEVFTGRESSIRPTYGAWWQHENPARKRRRSR